MTNAPSPRRLCFDPKSRLIGLRVGKVEFGQHIHEAYGALVAGLLGIDAEHIVVMPVSTTSSPDDGLTVGSLSVQVTGPQIETAIKETWTNLRASAGRRLNCDADSLQFNAGQLTFQSETASCDLFDIVDREDIATVAPPIPANPILGQKTYIQDLRWPNMIHARALRGRPLSEVKQHLTSEDQVIEDGGFAAIAALDETRLSALWSQLPEPPHKGGTQCDGPVRGWMDTCRMIETENDAEIETLSRTLCASRPFMLHGSIAPSCGVALWSGETLTVWSHSQGIFPLKAQIANALALDLAQVEVHHAQSAGSYGHNGADDAAMDAAMIAMHIKGRHVRVAWPREDDMREAPVGAPMVVRASAQLGPDNRITAWHQDILSGPHGQRPGAGGNMNLLAAMEKDPGLRPSDLPDLPTSVGLGAARNAAPIYDIAQATARTRIVQDLPVRTSSLRGLGAQMNTVAIEALMDQMAGDIGESPFAFRRRHLTDDRAIAVLDALEAICPSPGAPEEGVGIALGRYKNKAAYAAVAVQLRLEDEPIPVKVIAVVDAGRVVSLDGTRNQIEGGILQAASWTLIEGVHLREGRIDASNWDEYPVLDWGRIPEIEVHLISNETAPSLGAGECMVGPTSAAIANAVAACIGQPLLDFPLNRDALITALA